MNQNDYPLSTLSLTEPPGIGVTVFLCQRVQSFIPFLPHKSKLICELEEIRSHIDEPFRIDRTDIAHVLLGCKDELMVDNPFGLSIEKRTARMNVDLMIIHKGPVASFRVSLCCMEEEARYDGFADEGGIASA